MGGHLSFKRYIYPNRIPFSKKKTDIIIVRVGTNDVPYKDFTIMLDNIVPAGIYMFKVNSRNTRTNGIVLVSLLLPLSIFYTLFFFFVVVNFEQVNASLSRINSFAPNALLL